MLITTISEDHANWLGDLLRDAKNCERQRDGLEVALCKDPFCLYLLANNVVLKLHISPQSDLCIPQAHLKTMI